MKSSQFAAFPLVVSLLLAGAYTPAYAGDTPLTLYAAQKVAVDRSRLLASKDYAATAQREMAAAAGQLPDPVLRVGVENLPVEGPDRLSLNRDSMTMRRVGVMQELPRAEKRRLRSERFEREAERSLAEKSALSATVERDTALAWLNLYYTQRMASVLSEQVVRTKLEIHAVEAQYRSGQARQAEVLAAHASLSRLHDRQSDIERRVRDARIGLARWVGDAAQLPIAGEPSIDEVRLDLTNLERELNHHPELAVATKQEQIAVTEASLARADRKADWSVEVAYQQRGSSYSNMVSVGVSVPLQWNRKNRQDRELTARLAQVEEAKAIRDETLRRHVAELQGMVNEWTSNRERYTRYTRELIPFAKSRVEAEMASYRGGKTTQTNVLMARREETEVRLQALELEMETARLWAQINFLIPQSSQSPHPSAPNNQDYK
ncbi:TolC family protein [Telluria aromaticivorans]|uniref:TolC family protein n=1 Tax=Telluria aromaticivorans TaxID=2725995 RepID=A0A7Y2NXY8_9BURK|nr:TolC family protein [Telluria aromaticivorans]NNG21429.1 TolC family protein [Telluria aromaticivorans]